jgi:septation ring formation regulator EzrA
MGRHIRKHRGIRMISLKLTTIITLVTLIVSAGVAWGILTQKVDNLEKDIDYSKNIDVEKTKDIEVKIVGLEKKAISNEVLYSELNEDVDEIKEDMKDIENKVDDMSENIILLISEVSKQNNLA